MAHIVTLNNDKNVTMSVATDESLWFDLSYYIRKEMGEEFYGYLESYKESLLEENNELKKQVEDLKANQKEADELRYEIDCTNKIVKEIQAAIKENDLDSAMCAIEQILDY